MAANNDEGPQFLRGPMIARNPNPRVPLAAVLRFRANGPVTTRVEIFDGYRTWGAKLGPESNPQAGYPVVGMRAARQHTISVTIEDAAGRRKKSAPLEYTTPPLPAHDFPPIRLDKTTPQRMEPGFTLVSVRRRAPGKSLHHTPAQRQFTEAWGMVLAMDERAEVVWYYQAESRVAGIQRLDNGNLLFHLTDHRSQEIDVLGNKVNEWYAANRPAGPVAGAIAVPAKTLHHQPHEMPNGNFLVLAAVAREIKDFYTSELDPAAPRKTQMVMGDAIMEIDRKTGAVLWSWDAFDHLDVGRIGYNTLEPYWWVRGFPGHADWTHGNGVAYDARDDSVIASFRLQDAIVKIDRKSGAIKWILGDPSGWGKLADKLLKPVGENFRWHYHGHNPRVTCEGTIMFFDNGILQARPFDKAKSVDQVFSRGVEYQVDEQAMTVREVWSSAHKVDEHSLVAWAMSEAHLLPVTKNALVIFANCGQRRADLDPFFNERNNSLHSNQMPSHARIREYTRTNPAEILFEARVADPNDIVQWEVFGGNRVPSMYSSEVKLP